MAPSTRIQELIKKNPVHKALDYDFVDSVMRGVFRAQHPETVSITSLSHSVHKKRVGHSSSSIIYGYVITGVTAEGLLVRSHMIYSAHTDGSRAIAYAMLRLLIAKGFNDSDQYRVIQPLLYLPEEKALVYEAVEGGSLFHLMDSKAPIHDLQQILVRTAQWLIKFHSIKLSPEEATQVPAFTFDTMNWNLDDVTTHVARIDQNRANNLREFLNTYRTEDQRLQPEVTPGITYGDLHPENIIIQQPTDTGLTMIDFTDVTLGDQLRDCGTFIQQFKFMGRGRYTPDETRLLSRFFLENYFGKSLVDLAPSVVQRINLYQSWNSLRGFVYFFFNQDNRDQSYGLLDDAWHYLDLVRNQSRDINLDHE